MSKDMIYIGIYYFSLMILTKKYIKYAHNMDLNNLSEASDPPFYWWVIRWWVIRLPTLFMVKYK